MKIAIVGMGISGSSTLKHLFDLNAVNSNDQIDVFDPRPFIGTGYAYQNDDATLLMNSYSTRLSLNENDPDEYINWLSKNYPEYLSNDFSPRFIFGEYLKDKYQTYLEYENVTHIQEKVIDINIEHNQLKSALVSKYKYTLTTELQSYEEYDVVFLTIGHPPYADHYNLSKENNYIHNPYPIDKMLEMLKEDLKIGIIGSSLTAIDITHAIIEHMDLKYPIHLYSRHQPFTNVKNKLYTDSIYLTIDEGWIIKTKEKYNGYIPLEVIWQQLVSDFSLNDVDLIDAIDRYQTGSVSAMKIQTQKTPRDLQIIQRYVGLLTAYLPSLNMALTPHDREIYHKKYKRLFEHFRTQFPAVKMKLMHHWLETEKIKFITGLESINAKQSDKFILTTSDGFKYKEDILINATGFEQSLYNAAKFDPLIKSLYNKEILTQNALGGVQISWPSAHPLTPKYGEIQTIYISGAWISTTQYGNNNAQMTAKHGKDMVQTFKNQFNR